MTLHRKLLFAAFMIIVIARAWVCDDAYITMRVADNILEGYGPVWNVAERVQVFTHPLWLFILTIFYVFLDHYTSLLLPSILCSAAVMWLLAKHSKTILPMVAAICCTSFVSFSTSGMENALSHLLVIVAVIYSSGRMSAWYERSDVVIVTAVWALAILTRPDFLIIGLPAFALVFYLKLRGDGYMPAAQSDKEMWLSFTRYFLIGISPVILWGLFSLFYYGWPVPNTAFAKLGHGLPQLEILKQGIMYLVSSFAKDPVLVLIIFIGIAFKFRQYLSLKIGMILYLLYIVWIGGDFCSGRLLTPLFAMSLMILGLTIRKEDFVYQKSLYLALLIIFLLPMLKPDTDSKVGGVIFEESYFQSISALRHQDREGLREKSLHGKAAKKISDQYEECAVVESGIGMFGFYLDKDVTVVDPLGLADPLLCHLPASDTLPWRVGHYKRDIPEGYERSVALGGNFITDRDLHEYYEDIRLVTRGDLWDWQRLKTIVALNLGLRDHLVEEYVDRQKQ